MARSVFAPLLPELLGRYPELRIELEPYSSDWSQEPREDVDVFFKVRSPKDSVRRVRVYPGTKRGIFASPGYVAERGHPGAPDELVAHTCIGSGTWKLTRGPKVATPNLVFRVVVKRSEARKRLVPILPLWNPEPITLCALFSSPARLTPKVQVLLDFLGEYIGTDRDPRLDGVPAKGLFTEPKLMETSGP
jgi:DNA-binding transcriptional LysR family regulator